PGVERHAERMIPSRLAEPGAVLAGLRDAGVGAALFSGKFSARDALGARPGDAAAHAMEARAGSRMDVRLIEVVVATFTEMGVTGASRWRPRAPPPWWLSRRDACCSSTASAAWGGRMPRASRSSVSDVGAGAPAIMLVAGEASGDLHGAALCRALQAARPGCRLFGMGGARMASAGMELLVDVTAAAATGASEAVGRVPMLYRAYRRLR